MSPQPAVCPEYVPIYWDSSPPPYEVVRGHVSESSARVAVERETGWPQPTTAVAITHAYARWIPRQNSQYDAEFWLCERGPGAFAVTILEEPSK